MDLLTAEDKEYIKRHNLKRGDKFKVVARNAPKNLADISAGVHEYIFIKLEAVSGEDIIARPVSNPKCKPLRLPHFAWRVLLE
jgi:hypothetical protein